MGRFFPIVETKDAAPLSLAAVVVVVVVAGKGGKRRNHKHTTVQKFKVYTPVLLTNSYSKLTVSL